MAGITFEQIFGNSLDELKKIKIYTTQSNIFDHPFYQFDWDQTEANTMPNSVIDNKVHETVMELKNAFDLPDELVYVYLHAQSFEHDLNVNNRTFLSLNNVKTISGEHPNFFDFAVTYNGMGWINMFSWHNKLKKIVVRMDGGSSGYDRQYNYEKYKNDYSFDFEEKIDLKKMFYSDPQQ